MILRSVRIIIIELAIGILIVDVVAAVEALSSLPALIITCAIGVQLGNALQKLLILLAIAEAASRRCDNGIGGHLAPITLAIIVDGGTTTITTQQLKSVGCYVL